LREWTATVEQALADIEILRKSLIARVVKMLEDAGKFSERWEEKRKAQEVRSRKRLAEAKITSPEEVLRRVGELRSKIQRLSKKRQPRLEEVERVLKREDAGRGILLSEIAKVDGTIRAGRTEKAGELTEALGGDISISIQPFADREEYQNILSRLVDQVSTRDAQVKNRETQIGLVAASILPRELAAALRTDGVIVGRRSRNSARACGITENTQRVLWQNVERHPSAQRPRDARCTGSPGYPGTETR